MIGLAIRESLAPVLFIAAVVGVVAIALHCGCEPAKDPRAHNRAVVLSIARGVEAADVACASIARAKKDAPLARDCAFSRDAAKVSLEAAEDALDSDDPSKAADVPCQVAQAVAYATALAGLVEKAGGKLPKALVDGFELAPMLAGGCRG